MADLIDVIWRCDYIIIVLPQQVEEPAGEALQGMEFHLYTVCSVHDIVCMFFSI